MQARSQSVNYRRIATVAVTAAVLDALERRFDPRAAGRHLVEGLTTVESEWGPVARRLFELAYALAPENPECSALWPRGHVPGEPRAAQDATAA
jgi:hypothetical protein